MNTDRYFYLDNYQMAKEAHSLEEWGKIVDNALRENTGINNDYKI